MDKKRKNFYHNQSGKKKKLFNVEANLRGFICSCNNREKDCVREAYNLLNKFADILYKPDEANKEKLTGGDIEDELSSELEQLKSETKRFQVLESGAKNFLFIRTTLENPLELVVSVFDDLMKNPEQRQTRFLLRLIPIEVTCKAYSDDIVAALKPLIGKYFKEGDSYAIRFNHRNNNSLSRDGLIKKVAEVVEEFKLSNTVNLSNPMITVLIEVIKGFAFLGVIRDYEKYKKFNMHAFAEDVEESAVDNEEVMDSKDAKKESDNGTENKDNVETKTVEDAEK